MSSREIIPKQFPPVARYPNKLFYETVYLQYKYPFKILLIFQNKKYNNDN